VRAAFLGDSYDIVKQSLLRWLGSIGTWETHPMFTEPLPPEQASAFSCLLGTRLLSKETFTLESDRSVYLAPARNCGYHVFLDPDTGIRLEPTRGKEAPLYVFGAELVEIASARPDRLTLVFDQSLARGREREQLLDKLSYFADHSLHGFAYASHACFVLVGKDGSLVKRALETLKRESRLPASRFVEQEPQNNQLRRTSPSQAKKELKNKEVTLRWLPRPPAMILIQVSYAMMAVTMPFAEHCMGLWSTYLMMVMSWSALVGGVSFLLPRARGTWDPAPLELFGRGDTYLVTTVIWLILVFVMGYAAGYHNLSLCEPASFNEQLSGVDAIYFALVTLTTVGFGDISARSQIARVIVTTQLFGVIAFAVFVVGALVNIVTSKPEENSRK